MIQYWHEKHRELRTQRDEEGFDGFTLIELLIVIVVLGILAATVIFALGGVTGQSASAACNSDAKTTEVAVQAFIASPDNTGVAPSSISELYTHTFVAPGDGKTDTFMTQQSNNNYTVALGGDLTGFTPAAADDVYVHVNQVTLPSAAATGWVQYDNPAVPNPCNTTPIG